MVHTNLDSSTKKFPRSPPRKATMLAFQRGRKGGKSRIRPEVPQTRERVPKPYIPRYAPRLALLDQPQATLPDILRLFSVYRRQNPFRESRQGADRRGRLFPSRRASRHTTIGHAAFSRQDTDATARRPFYCYLDEFQNFTTLSMANMFSERRKYPRRHDRGPPIPLTSSIRPSNMQCSATRAP